MTEREVSREVTIDAPPEVVWKALTDGAEVERWFAFQAKVDPRVGGKLWLSWGPECEGTATIELCEPERRLRTNDDTAMPDEDGRKLHLATEYLLEGHGGRTRLRVVTSGFGASGWDDEIDSISRGWDVFLRGLKHYVERHRGTPRRLVFAQANVDLELTDAWERLFSPRGLGAVASAREGEDLAVTTAAGRRLSGAVQVWNPPKDLALVIRELNDAHLWVEVTPWGEAAAVKLTLSTFGLPEDVASTVETEWRSMLEALFGSAS